MWWQCEEGRLARCRPDIPGCATHTHDKLCQAPTYELSYGIGTATQMDYRLMQRETVALTQMLLDLSRVPYADLRKETAS